MNAAEPSIANDPLKLPSLLNSTSRLKLPSRRAARFLLLAPLLCSGCIFGPSNPGATKSATDIDPKQALPDFWYDKPASATVASSDFQKLWNASADEARARLFEIDRTDFRSGLLTTKPLVCKQFFEVWRSDDVTLRDVTLSSIQPIRRTIHFEFRRLPDGLYEMSPKVLVERESVSERRVSSVTQYQQATASIPGLGTPETDLGQSLPDNYWYAVSRDDALERDLASAIRSKL
jgi:hypothetical protein